MAESNRGVSDEDCPGKRLRIEFAGKGKTRSTQKDKDAFVPSCARSIGCKVSRLPARHVCKRVQGLVRWQTPSSCKTRTPEQPVTSRRTVLRTAGLSAIGAALSTLDTGTASTERLNTFTSPSLHITLQYPRSWFRSERDGSLVVVHLSDAIAATVSRKAIILAPQRSDAFAAAYDVVRDRIEKEGAEIFIKRAAFREGALEFMFETEVSLPNGDVVRRVGVSKCLGEQERGSAVACIVTAPKESWGTLKPVAEAVLESFRAA